MAIINCPSCGRRISNRAGQCPFCNFKLTDAGPGISADEARRRQQRQQMYRLQMQTYAAVTLSVIGFAWFWYETYLIGRPAPPACLATLAVGVVWYLGARAWMIISKFRQSG